MGTDRVTLKIPRPLYDKIKIVIEDSGFSSANEFVVYVLRDLLSATGTAKKDCPLRKSKPSASDWKIWAIYKACRNHPSP